MILGQVIDRVARVKLQLVGQITGLSIDFVVDTGFDGYLAMPESIINRIPASLAGRITVRLADGSRGEQSFYNVTLDWDGTERVVEAIALTGGVPLLGTELLADHLTTIEMVDGGEVIIEPIS